MSMLPVCRKGKLPVILQAERSECGLACLAMILAYYGHKIDLNTLRRRCNISQHGVTLKSLVNLAAKLNLVVRPLRLELEDMRNLTLPALLHWDMDHFVILKKVKGKQLEIHNPAAGLQKLGWQEAGKHFTGVALELMPTSNFQKKDERQLLQLSELWKFTDGISPILLQLLLLSTMLQLFAIALPFYTQVVLDDVLVNLDVDLLKLLSAGFLLLIVFRQLTELLRAHVVLYLGNKISFQFATRLCRHLLHLPLDYFSRRHIGDIVSRFGSLNNVRDFLCSGIVEIVIDGMMVIATLLLMFFYDGLLTSIALVAVILYGLIRLASYRQFHARNEEWINDRAVENTVFMENISAIQGIKLFGREAARLGSWQNTYATTINSGIKVQKLGINVKFFHGLLVGLENVLLLLAGAYAVIDGALSVGMLMAFISFKDHFYRSIFSLLDKLFEFRLLDVHLERLGDITFTEAEQLNDLPGLTVERVNKPCDVVLENIAYRYASESSYLFQNVSLAMDRNEVVVIVGATGCGKSTLLRIVLSLIKPEEGRLLLNGRSLGPNDIEAYRQQITGVLQNDELLSGTILENITFFDSTPDLERAKTAACQAMLGDEIAMMPMQFNTMVGNMGNALSGGQCQRILLARALYQQPSLLVLDEATSHLDVGTESLVNQSIRRLDIPVLMVAHRPETVLGADRILLLTPIGLEEVSHHDFRGLISDQNNNDVITA